MKKIFSLIAIAATVLMASCSKDALEIPEVGGANPEVTTFERFVDGEGALAITIAAPSQTRAADTYGNNYGDNYGDFNDGEAYEHTVENATLILFKGKSADNELTYTLHSAYELTNTNWDPVSSNHQITKTGTIVQKIEPGTLATDEDLFALVILNRHNYFTINNTTHEISHNSVVLNGKTASVVAGIVLNEENRNFAAQSFFMSNMPYCSKPGGTVDPGTTATMKALYKVNPKSIYPNETEARVGSETTTINVERALAKVEVTATKTDVKTEDGKETPGEILGWFIDNTNKTTYAVRHTTEPVYDPYSESAFGYLRYMSSEHNTYRFVSQFPVVPNTDIHRTFWAIDPNYNTAVAAGELTTKAGIMVDNHIMSYNPDGTVASGNLRPVGSYYYCTENTFDIARQSVKNTTRVVVAVKFNDGNDFYTITPGETGKIWNTDDLKLSIISQYLNRVYPAQWLDEYINGSVVTKPTDLFSVTITADVNAEGKPTGTATATMTLKTLSLGQLKTGKTVEDATTAWNNNYAKAGEGNAWIAANISLSYYKGGVAYYSALIKHFGDEETPWEDDGEMQNNTTASGVYGTNSANYLGRYGVVRNNWYKVNIKGVRTIGSPVVPTLDGDEPDDEVEKFIKVDINIMPWVIRYQDTTL